jgi:hypothetical protein
VADDVIDLFEEGVRPITLIAVIPRPSHLLIEKCRMQRVAKWFT